MLSSQIRHYLNAQRILMTIAGTCLGLLLSVLANWLSDPDLLAWLLPVVLAVTVVAGGVALFLALRAPLPRISVRMSAPITIRTEEDGKRFGRWGFVGFVPLFNPMGNSPACQLTIEERRKAIAEQDFERLVLHENSNFRPTIKAILAHSTHLQHCWLIATQGPNGSLPDAQCLAAYLKKCANVPAEIHVGAEWSVPVEDDVAATRKVYELVQEIFSQAAKRYGIPANQMVGDITTGYRSLPLGMILACLNKDQDIEFVGTSYDAASKVTDKLVPTIYGFEIKGQ